MYAGGPDLAHRMDPVLRCFRASQNILSIHTFPHMTLLVHHSLGAPEPMEVQPDERFRQSLELQVDGKPQELAPFEKRIPLFGAAAPPQPRAPPPPPVVSDRQKPQFTQVQDSVEHLCSL